MGRLEQGQKRAPHSGGHRPSRRRRDPELESIRPLAVSVDEAEKMLSVSRCTLYKAVMRGEIESFVIGQRTRRIAVSVLERYVGSAKTPQARGVA